jgi:ABC-type glycerol-3-phosphate transport system permease component
MLRSVFVAFVSAALVAFVGSVVAYIFARKHFFAKEFFFMLFIAVLMMPAIVGLPVLYAFVYDSGLINTYFAIWLPLLAGSQVGAVFLFRTFFSQQPESVFEAAVIDGASDATIYAQIVVPLAFPILALNFIGVLCAQYNDFLWPSVVLKSNNRLLLMTVLQRSSELFTNRQSGVNYAMYLISGIPLIITTAISMRYFKDGNFGAGLKL